jgi:hypothetical protein
MAKCFLSHAGRTAAPLGYGRIILSLATAIRLRLEWKDWQGEDSLHEMAFGEPED